MIRNLISAAIAGVVMQLAIGLRAAAAWPESNSLSLRYGNANRVSAPSPRAAAISVTVEEGSGVGRDQWTQAKGQPFKLTLTRGESGTVWINRVTVAY